MKLTFTRGTLATKPQEPSAAGSLRIEWLEDGPKAFVFAGEGRSLLILQKKSNDLYLGFHESFGTLAVSKTPWWSELPSIPSQRGLWLSYQGFSEGVWYDGIFGRFEEGAWTDLVLPGPSFTLEFGRSRLALEDVDGFWREEKSFAMKQSLIEAVKVLFAGKIREGESHALIQRDISDVDFLLDLLLLRLAFPRTSFRLWPKDVAWKRLAQNLNIEVLKQESNEKENSVVLPELGPKEKVLDVLRWQQSKSPFIPLHLLQSLTAL